MYYQHFGLKQPPFKITPDTSLFFPGGNRGAILEALIYAIVNGEGIVKVVGEVGTGKTMLCRMLEQELEDNIEVVYLANPSLSPDQIPYAIAFELDLEVAASDNRLQVMNDLQDYLLKKHTENGQVVVFVEEAQAMSIDSLEELRLLSNLETGQNKLLQIVLFGQPELDEMISRPEIRQLKERITYTFQLSPFKSDEIKEYINSRLRACGYRLGDAFNPSAIKAISKYSKGLLRRINILSDKSLLAAYAANMNQVTAKHVRVAAKDSEFVKSSKGFKLVLIGVVVLFLIMISVLVSWNNNFMGYYSLDKPVPVTEDQLEPESGQLLLELDEEQISLRMMDQDLQDNLVEEAKVAPVEEKISMNKQIVTIGQDLFIDDMPTSEQYHAENEETKQLLDLEIFFFSDIRQKDSLDELNLLMEKLVTENRPYKKQSRIDRDCENCTSIVFKSDT